MLTPAIMNRACVRTGRHCNWPQACSMGASAAGTWGTKALPTRPHLVPCATPLRNVRTSTETGANAYHLHQSYADGVQNPPGTSDSVLPVTSTRASSASRAATNVRCRSLGWGFFFTGPLLPLTPARAPVRGPAAPRGPVVAGALVLPFVPLPPCRARGGRPVAAAEGSGVPPSSPPLEPYEKRVTRLRAAILWHRSASFHMLPQSASAAPPAALYFGQMQQIRP